MKLLKSVFMVRTYNILQEVEKAGITDPFYQLMVGFAKRAAKR